jgi:hypothetical protein
MPVLGTGSDHGRAASTASAVFTEEISVVAAAAPRGSCPRSPPVAAHQVRRARIITAPRCLGGRRGGTPAAATGRPACRARRSSSCHSVRGRVQHDAQIVQVDPRPAARYRGPAARRTDPSSTVAALTPGSHPRRRQSAPGVPSDGRVNVGHARNLRDQCSSTMCRPAGRTVAGSFVKAVGRMRVAVTCGHEDVE